MVNKEYMCVLGYDDKCINNNDCRNCDYGVKTLKTTTIKHNLVKNTQK